jgi:hypothetical protein
MHRTAVIVASLAASLATGGVLAVTGGAQEPGGQTIKLVSGHCAAKINDVPPRGKGRFPAPGAGDTLTLWCPVTDASGAKLGALNVGGQIAKGGSSFTGIATGVYKLATGEIFIASRLTSDLDHVIGAVTGGSGAYAGARGTFTSIDRPGTKNGDPSDDTIALLP